MSMVTPPMTVAHVRTLLADVDVIQGPLVLFSIIVLDPSESRGTGPERRQNTHKKCLARISRLVGYCIYKSTSKWRKTFVQADERTVQYVLTLSNVCMYISYCMFESVCWLCSCEK